MNQTKQKKIIFIYIMNLVSNDNTEKIKSIETFIQENIELKREIATLRQDIDRLKERTDGLQKEIVRFYQYFLKNT
jgi:predicted  nucleic acid-binding Zn-ribbon protein